MEDRLQKIMAHAGFGSRRKCEDFIRQGRVTVNGAVAQLGQKADPARDHIAFDGQPVHVDDSRTYVALYKPRGVISDQGDPTGRRTARDLISLPGRLYPAGRLDLDSEGLLLMTNDGDLTYRLTHPSYEHEKEYRVDVAGRPDAALLQRWRAGVDLDGQRTAPAEVDIKQRGKDHTWLRVVLHEGRKRQIRRVAQLLGHPVRRLIRVRIGPLHMGDLKPGQWRHLTEHEVRTLQDVKRKKEHR